MDADLISAHLDRIGPTVDLVRAIDRDSFKRALKLDAYDVILSDYSLPGFDGLSALVIARGVAPETPFIFVSGVLGEEIAAESFKQGATDYVLKSRLARLEPAVTRALAESEARANQRQIEQALAEREASYRALVDVIGTVVWSTRPDGQLDECPQWEALTGQPAEAHRGWGWLDALHPDDKAHARVVWSAALETSGIYDVEYRLRSSSGDYLWYNSRGVPVIADGVASHWVGVCIDINDRKQAEEHTQLLINELNHRVKNNLATVQAIAVQTLRDTVPLPMAKKDFMARLRALARAHDVLTRENWESATLGEVVMDALEPHGGEVDARYEIGGPSIRLDAKTAISFSMALHELSTNAAKYGAFSVPTGRVRVDWQIQEGGAEPSLRLVWRETGGPPVARPERRGFGSKLIERGLAAELRGEVQLNFELTGVVCTIDAPLSSVGTGAWNGD